jgi:serine/threonine-protein kinase
MVGAFGEVQVMDWGLAKVLPEGGVADEERASRGRQAPEGATVIRTGRSAGTDPAYGTDTQAGSLLGTPAYIPPEQATGAVDRLDRRADVFGLGAILCEILTGQPPYVGRSGEEIRDKAAAGDQAEALARLGACGADAELLALATACLAPLPADRPRDAQAVADATAAYLHGVEERLRRAEVERAEALVKAAEERKRRRVQLALAASVLATLGLAGGGGLWVQRQQAARAAEEAAVAGDVAAALREADLLRRQERYDAARVAVSRAEGLLAGGGAALGGRVAAARLDLDMLETLDQIRLEGAVLDVAEDRFDARRAAPLYAAAFRDYGIPVGELEAGEAVRRLGERAIRAELVAALDDWARVAGDRVEAGRLTALAQAADPDPAGPAGRLRQALAQKDRAALVNLAAGDAPAKLGPPQLVALGGNLRALGAGAAAVDLLRRAQHRYPDDFWLNHNLAFTLVTLKPPRADEAVGFFRAALALRPDSPGAHLNLGYALRAKGDFAGAVAASRRAIDLAPQLAPAHNNLGVALRGLGDPAGAVAAYRRAIELRPQFAEAYYNLGRALGDLGDYAGATAAGRRAVEIEPRHTAAHYNLGVTLGKLRDLDGAAAAYRRAIELNPDFAEAHCNLGHTLRDQGHFADALAALRHGHELGAKNPAWRYPSDRWVQQAEQFVALDAKLPAVLRGDARPADDAERVLLARACSYKGLQHAAARLSAEALAGTPALADDLAAGHRYNAACYAALAGCGRGADAAGLDDAARGRWRRQALDWLRAELAAWEQRLAGGRAGDRDRVRKTLRHWEQDPDFAGVRGDDALTGLPADERAAWRAAWAGVADVLRKAGGGHD